MLVIVVMVVVVMVENDNMVGLYKIFYFIWFIRYENLSDPTKSNRNLETALEQAIKEATDDETFRKVKRMSYSGHAVDEVREN